MSENQLGVQPLDAVMTSLELTNADLVAASTEQLTFKMVQKSRKGRRITPNIQNKILHAIQNAKLGQHFRLADLFTY